MKLSNLSRELRKFVSVIRVPLGFHSDDKRFIWVTRDEADALAGAIEVIDKYTRRRM